MKYKKEIKKLVKRYKKDLKYLYKRSLKVEAADLDFFIVFMQLLRDKMILLNDNEKELQNASLMSIVAAIECYNKYLSCAEKYFEVEEEKLTPKNNKTLEVAIAECKEERQKYFDDFCGILRESINYWRIYNDTL